MKNETRVLRQQQIEQAAYDVLEERGYSGTSMLAIAQKARASNETLYNWYGDKNGLFKTLVTRNAADVKKLLDTKLRAGTDPMQTLGIMGPMLLEVLTGARAVGLNRAAAADPSGELGKVIAEAGREAITPMIGKILERARDLGHISFDTTQEAAELYVMLLVGDLQIRRVVGRMPQPNAAFCRQRSDTAIVYLKTLLSTR